MQNIEPIWRIVDDKRPDYEALADRIWDKPEIAYDEYESTAEHTAMLRAEGFRVTENVAGIPTAVMGEAGEDGPVIAILGEYDALPGLSQEAGIAEPKPLPGNGLGHGCGHNLLGSASLLAAAAVKDWMAANGIKGRVRYYGCPAEEGGAAKAFMVREGAFKDVDIAISWHPAAGGIWQPLRSGGPRLRTPRESPQRLRPWRRSESTRRSIECGQTNKKRVTWNRYLCVKPFTSQSMLRVTSLAYRASISGLRCSVPWRMSARSERSSCRNGEGRV